MLHAVTSQQHIILPFLANSTLDSHNIPMNSFINVTLTLIIAIIATKSEAFAPSNEVVRRSIHLNADATTSEEVTVDPKEAVKLFGRLAEKYIMLDSSGGMCCYSACSGT